MIRNTMLISLIFYSLKSESYAEDNKGHLKAKNKVSPSAYANNNYVSIKFYLETNSLNSF